MALTLALTLNIALLVTLSVAHQSIVRRWREWTLARLLVSGLLFGGIAVVGMMTPFRPVQGVQYDGRSIILAAAGLFGGPIVAAVAGSVAAAYRLWLGGAGAATGVSVIIESAALGVAYHYLRRRHPGAMRWLPLYGFGVLVHAGMLVLQLAFLGEIGPSMVAQIWFPVLVLYPIGMLLVCRLMLDQEQRLEDEHALRTLNESLERMVGERTNELRATNEQLQEANEAKSQFLRAMSHELRTPLNSVIGFSDILTRGVAGDVNCEQRRQLGMINRSGKRLLAIINDVLDLSRIEANVIQLATEPFDAEVLAREIAESMMPEAEAKGLSLSVNACDGAMVVESDPDKVGQILLNLLANAVKYTDAGGVTIRIRRPGHRMVAIEVSDTGPGIPEDLREQVFEEFVQGDEHREGTGLGLAISRRLAELLGGTIALESRPGEGSTFTLLLPEGATRHGAARPRG